MRYRIVRTLAVLALVVPGVLVAGAGPARASSAPVLPASALSAMRLTDDGSFPTITRYRAADEASGRPLSVVRLSTLIAGGYATRSVCHPTDLTVTSSVTGFCWDSTDDSTADWYPQGVTGSGDGVNGGTLYPPCDGCAGRKVVAVSWHSGAGYQPYGDGGLARVTFVDVTAGDTGAPYRHALLVEPDGTAAGYHAIESHADGIVWYGDKLALVTGGAQGQVGAGEVVRVFDLTHFWQMSSTTSGTVGCTATACSAAYSLFALPEVGYYQFPDGAICSPLRTGTAASLTDPCLDSVSLDRSTSPASIITTEYDDQGPQGRILRWPLAAGTAGLLQPDSDGYVRPDQGWTSPIYRMQGAVFTGGSGVVEGLCPNGAPAVTDQPDDAAHDAIIDGFAKSCLHKATISADGSLDVHYWTTTMENAENLSYWPSSGELWLINEFRGSTDTHVSPPKAYPSDRLVLAIHCPNLTCS